ncbi:MULTISPECIES: hypothetical protein [unclassified Rathayibacter]|uniref:hypothetical protein n=1 Tax=unclassified Rathayibacter TaxID=2609250 RepID=UPI00104D0DFA|nr:MULTISPECIES: hypothetical protein [unclassified Rathayibacter]TCL80447.1 hypothetical protein EDF49_109168 [Rathayibacter sp. PhB192]TCM25973.1 hypothetical protein EDF43_109168 [Rathayibacter sp. PhB179]
MPDEFERKTSADYYADVNRVQQMRAPRMSITVGTEADREYQETTTISYLTAMVGHLLERIEHLEAATETIDGGTASSTFDRTIDGGGAEG